MYKLQLKLLHSLADNSLPKKTGGNRTKFRIPKKLFGKSNNKLLTRLLTFTNKGTEFHFWAKGLIVLLNL
jgi:hypothetical protein